MRVSPAQIFSAPAALPGTFRLKETLSTGVPLGITFTAGRGGCRFTYSTETSPETSQPHGSLTTNAFFSRRGRGQPNMTHRLGSKAAHSYWPVQQLDADPEQQPAPPTHTLLAQLAL